MFQVSCCTFGKMRIITYNLDHHSSQTPLMPADSPESGVSPESWCHSPWRESADPLFSFFCHFSFFFGCLGPNRQRSAFGSGFSACGNAGFACEASVEKLNRPKIPSGKQPGKCLLRILSSYLPIYLHFTCRNLGEANVFSPRPINPPFFRDAESGGIHFAGE